MDICKVCGLEVFIRQVSLDYIVGQNGAMLSGGQKQKIALARFLDKTVIIITHRTEILCEVKQIFELNDRNIFDYDCNERSTNRI